MIFQIDFKFEGLCAATFAPMKENGYVLYCVVLCTYSRTATGMDGTLPKCNFENLKPVEISKNSFGII